MRRAPCSSSLGEIAHVRVAAGDQLLGLRDIADDGLVFAEPSRRAARSPTAALACFAVLGRIALQLGRAEPRDQILVLTFYRLQLVEHGLSSRLRILSPRKPAAETPPRRRRAASVHPRVVGVHRASRSTARTAPAPETRRRAAARSSPIVAPGADSRVSSAAPVMSRSRANSRTVTRMPAAPLPRAPARRQGRRSLPRSRRRRLRKTRASRSAQSA